MTYSWLHYFDNQSAVPTSLTLHIPTYCKQPPLKSLHALATINSCTPLCLMVVLVSLVLKVWEKSSFFLPPNLKLSFSKSPQLGGSQTHSPRLFIIPSPLMLIFSQITPHKRFNMRKIPNAYPMTWQLYQRFQNLFLLKTFFFPQTFIEHSTITLFIWLVRLCTPPSFERNFLE
jgi:hypothetical protein